MPARHFHHSRWFSYTLLLINVLCWGAALVVTKPAFEVTTPFRFLLYRYFFAALLSVPLLVYYWSRVKKPQLAIQKIIPLELLGTTISLALLYLGLARTSAIEASMIATTAPIFVTLTGVLILKERQQLHETIGLLIAFAGTLLLTLVPMFINGSQAYELSLVGNLLVVAQNATIALYYVWAKRTYAQLPKLFVTTISFYVGLVTFFLFSLAEVKPLGLETSLVEQFNLLIQTAVADFQHLSVWFASLYMALFGSIIGLTAYIKGQDGIEASEASVFWYLEPLVYLPLGVALLGETIFPLQIVSLLLIFVGVFVTERRMQGRRHKKN